MKRSEFIALSAATMMLTALGIDIMLPAFDELRHYFGLAPDSTATAEIVTFFFMGQVTQIIFGVLSDRLGRIPILRLGFPLYAISGLAAAFAPSLTVMYVARFVMGMGASAVFMSTIAGVRDRFSGDEMARIMSLIFSIFLFTPILAPFLGTILLSITTWRIVFLTPPIFAVIVFLWSLRLEESLPPAQRTRLDWPGIKKSVGVVFRNQTFLRFTLITTLLFAALSAYVATAEHVIGGIYNRPKLFAWIFGGMGLVMSASSLLNARWSEKLGALRSMKALVILYTCVAALLLCVNLFSDPPSMPLFFAAIIILMSLNIAIEPNCSALALEPLGETAGFAASVYGTASFFFGALIGSFISHLMKHGVLALSASFAIMGIASWLLMMRPKKISDGQPVVANTVPGQTV